MSSFVHQNVDDSSLGARLTVIRSEHGTISKVIRKGRDGNLESDSSLCWVTDGWIGTVALDSLEQLAGLLNRLTSTHALVLGALAGVPLRQSKRLKTARWYADAVAEYGAEEVDRYVRTRTQEHCYFPDDAPGFLLIDYDPRGMPEAVRARLKAAGGLHGALALAAPASEAAGYVTRASTSAGISDSEGNAYPRKEGRHVYIPIRRASDGPRAARAWFERLWLAGFGWGLPSAAGTFLVRSPVDVAVMQANHIAFEGQPQLQDGLVQDQQAREALAVDGEVLDTETALPDLTPEERARYAELVEQERARLAPLLKEVRDVWITDYTETLIARGVDPARAQLLASQAADGGMLSGEFVPVWSNQQLAGTTLGAALEDPDRFIGQAMADPVEGPGYGRQTAKLLMNRSGRPYVRSHAHGLTIYQIEMNPAQIAHWLEAGPALDETVLVAAIDELGLGPELVPPDTPDEDADLPPGWRDLDPREHIARWIARLNRDYFICGGGRTRVVQERFISELNTWDYNAWYSSARNFEEFNALFLHEQIEVGRKPNGVVIFSTPSALWVKHPKARRYPKGMVFKPGGDVQEGEFNLWRGFGVEPRQGDWSLLKEHLRHIWCRDDPIAFHYLLGWLAHLVQKPMEKPGVMVAVLNEEEGVGRGIFGHALLHLMGTHGVYLQSAGQVLHRFNIFLLDKLLCFADETAFPGDKRNAGWLKAMITERRLMLEGKGTPLQQAISFLRFLIFTNDDWVVQASLTSRRYFVLNPSPERMQDHVYFAAIQTQLEAGGYEAMLYDLLHFDLSGFNPREAPATDALLQQRALSLKDEQAWVVEVLARGYVLRSEQEYFAEWREEVSTALLYASYEQFMERRRFAGRLLQRPEFGKFLVGLGFLSKRLTEGAIGERTRVGGIVPKQPIMAKRPPGYVFGTLHAARTQFNEKTGLKIAWDDISAEIVPLFSQVPEESGGVWEDMPDPDSK